MALDAETAFLVGCSFLFSVQLFRALRRIRFVKVLFLKWRRSEDGASGPAMLRKVAEIREKHAAMIAQASSSYANIVVFTIFLSHLRAGGHVIFAGAAGLVPLCWAALLSVLSATAATTRTSERRWSVPCVWLALTVGANIASIQICGHTGCAENVHILSAVYLVARVALSAAQGCISLVYLSQVLVIASDVHLMTHLAGAGRNTVERAIFTEVGGLLMLPLGNLLLKGYQGSSAREALRVEALGEKGSALTKLLGLMCNAVVELGRELEVAEHSPNFQAMVTLDPFGGRLRGRPFVSFMPLEEDRERFARLLTAAPTEGEDPQPMAIQSTLCDSNNTHLIVELLWVPLRDAEGHRRWTLGVRECSEPGVAPLQLFAEYSERRRESAVRSKRLRKAAAGVPRVPAAEDGELRAAVIGAGSSAATAEASSSSSACSSSSGFGQLAETGGVGAFRRALRPTKGRVKDLSLLKAVSRWNFSAAHCCDYHGAIQEVEERVRHLKSRRCRPALPWGDVQCDSCGMLQRWGAEDASTKPFQCEYCDGYQYSTLFCPAAPPAPPQPALLRLAL